MWKRYIDCAEILCLSKYNMYLEINLYYQCTIISIFFFHYINESTTVFLGKKTPKNNLLESISLKKNLDHLFVVTFIVQIMLWIFVNGMALTITKYHNCFISCFYEQSLGSFFIIMQVKSTSKSKFSCIIFQSFHSHVRYGMEYQCLI